MTFNDLVDKLKSRGEQFNLADQNLSNMTTINILRHEIEDKIFVLNKIHCAKNQSSQWEEISTYMELLINKSHSKKLSTHHDEDNKITIPQSEAPAYFEWVI